MPAEIWLDIFAHIPPEPPSPQQNSDVAALRLVSKDFSALVTRAHPHYLDKAATTLVRNAMLGKSSASVHDAKNLMQVSERLSLERPIFGVPFWDDVNDLLAFASQLQALTIGRLDAGSQSLHELNLALLPKLKDLNLAGNDLTSDHLRAMNLDKVKTLQSLNLSGNYLMKEGVIPFDLGHLRGLEALNMSRNYLSVGQVNAFNIAALTGMRTLDLSINLFRESEIAQLAVGGMERLRSLYLPKW